MKISNDILFLILYSKLNFGYLDLRAGILLRSAIISFCKGYGTLSPPYIYEYICIYKYIYIDTEDVQMCLQYIIGKASDDI
jgi:hypothetical protein